METKRPYVYTIIVFNIIRVIMYKIDAEAFPFSDASFKGVTGKNRLEI